MKLTLGISTCPNDTFIFDALINKRIDNQGFDFDLALADIQELNQMAQLAKVDLVKVSYAVYPLISSNYQLLTSGSALGSGVGPLVISKRKIYPDELQFARIAIPGEKTTANLLFTLAFPSVSNKRVYLFSDIEEAILSNEVDVGVIIHENRFTYQLKGLKKIVDLGNFWEETTGLPIPLGGIAVRRSLEDVVKRKVNSAIHNSVKYALENPHISFPFVRKYAQTMDAEVMKQHIELYVNNYSLKLNSKGIRAINELYRRSEQVGFTAENSIISPIFIE